MDTSEYKRDLKTAEIFKALGHPTRIYIAKKLSEGELPAGAFVEGLGADFSAVSQHLNVLKKSGVVESQRRGMNVYYRLVYPCIPLLIERIELRDQLFPNGEGILSLNLRKNGEKNGAMR